MEKYGRCRHKSWGLFVYLNCLSHLQYSNLQNSPFAYQIESQQPVQKYLAHGPYKNIRKMKTGHKSKLLEKSFFSWLLLFTYGFRFKLYMLTFKQPKYMVEFRGSLIRCYPNRYHTRSPNLNNPLNEQRHSNIRKSCKAIKENQS